MHRLMTESCCNVADAGLDSQKAEASPLCPKPRRLPVALPEFLEPNKCAKHSRLKYGGSTLGEVLDMIVCKGRDLRVASSSSPCSGCCSAPCFAASPPNRTDNPLVHDSEFIHQMKLHSLH